MRTDEARKAAIAELATLSSEELAGKLLDARGIVSRLEKDRDESREESRRIGSILDVVLDILWIEVRETKPDLGRSDIISVANRARELLRSDREGREIPF